MHVTAVPWFPPSGLDIVIERAGVAWDSVKVSAYPGDTALARLGARSGAVIRDPWSDHLYWLAPTGSADGWRLPYLTVLGVACYVAVPPAHRTQSPGPHWAVPPTRERLLTDPALLYDALTHACGPASGTGEGGTA